MDAFLEEYNAQYRQLWTAAESAKWQANVDITEETVDMLVARRAYEANATVFQVLKSVLHKALEI